MLRCWLLVFSLLFLTACGQNSEEIQTTAMSEGDWGWDEGAGCQNLMDVWRVDGDKLVFIEDGKAVGGARIISRKLEFSEREPGVKGRLQGANWIYLLKDPSTSEVVQRRSYFSVSYTSISGFKSLIAGATWQLSHSGKYIKLEEGAKQGKMVPCKLLEKAL